MDLAESAPPSRPDPIAAALGNASLLGLGYFLVGRWGLGVVNAVVSVTLVVLLGTAVPEFWLELTIVVWWALVVLHGWFVAGGPQHGSVDRKQRIVAAAVTAVVFVSVGLLRFDAQRIDSALANARNSGDCAKAVETLDGIWFGDRVGDAPLMQATEATGDACAHLESAAGAFKAALSGEANQLDAAYRELRHVRTNLPDHEQMSAATLDKFLGGLPAKNACTTALLDDWLTSHGKDGPTPDRAAATVRRTAPTAYLTCGFDQATDKNWTGAKAWYQRLLDRYPGDPGVPRAKQGATQATQQLELAKVRDLVQKRTYCDSPAKYSAAPPYGPGANRAVFFDSTDYSAKFPAEWRADDVANAVLVACMDTAKDGAAVRTCPYEDKSPLRLAFHPYTDVTFHKIAVPTKVYELRTGNRVQDTTVEIDGTSCPQTVHYRSFGYSDLGPPPDMQVEASDDQVRDAFRPIFQR
jgi:hypothetical protein